MPPEAIGLMRLLAVGEIARGRLDGHEEFDEILIRVEPSAELVGIEFEAHKPWRLRTIGRLLEVPVVGEIADGVRRSLGGSYAGSTYASFNDRVVKVYPGGLLLARSSSNAIGGRTNRASCPRGSTQEGQYLRISPLCRMAGVLVIARDH